MAPLRKAVEMEPTRWTFLIELAEAEMRNDDFRSAGQHIDEAIRRAPDRSEPMVKKAAWLRRQGDSSAEATIKGFIARKPTAAVLLHAELARLYRKQGRNEDSRKLFEEKVINDMGGYPQLDQADILQSYGLVNEELGNREVAIKSFEQAALFGSIEGSFHVARVLIREDREKAKAACERVLGAGYSSVYEKAQNLCKEFK
jgi:tetratricopeptide (TPR) repeat protein